MAEIRETDLDRSGVYVDLKLQFTTGRLDFAVLFMDQLGRIIVPVDPQWETLELVSVGEDPRKRRVVRQETRYEGERPSAQVIYIEQLQEK